MAFARRAQPPHHDLPRCVRGFRDARVVVAVDVTVLEVRHAGAFAPPSLLQIVAEALLPAGQVRHHVLHRPLIERRLQSLIGRERIHGLHQLRPGGRVLLDQRIQHVGHQIVSTS